MFSSKTSMYSLFLAILFASSVFAAPRDDQWKQVEQAVKKGLPKTAVEGLQPIIEGAIRDKAYAEACKAIGRKIALEGAIQGNKPEEKITRLEAEIAKVPGEMKPVLHAVLAHWYWQYYQRNRWRFMQRTQTAEPPGEDFTTWDIVRLFAEIDKQFDKALAAEKTLKTIKIAEYDDLLVKGTSSDSYRPTLYDFLAHEAIAFYSTGEHAATRAEDAFELSADSPIFADSAGFLAWAPQATDQTSPTLKTLHLFKKLLLFHQKDTDRTAFCDADLLRLNFGSNQAVGEEKDARYKAALKRYATTYLKHRISSRALHRWAMVLNVEGEQVDAHEIATTGKNRFPKSVGGVRCHNLIQQIEAKSVQVTTERVWNDPLPNISVNYRNIDKVHFRIVAYNWEERLGKGQQPEHLDQRERLFLLAKKPVLAWSDDLPRTNDYQPKIKELPAPKNLKPGSYFLVASVNDKFNNLRNQVFFTDFWVSKLAVVVRTNHRNGKLEGFVLDAKSGEPVNEAVVRAWSNERNRWNLYKNTTTDENGLFKIAPINQRHILLHAQHKEQKLSAGRSYYMYHQTHDPTPYGQTIFFTDRSIYRPGQTVHYKGLCIRVDQHKDNYKAIPNQSVTVVFRDPNGKEVTRQKHKANDYGSFSGSFTAPRDRLMGQMTLHCEGASPGAANINVEEYKRPKFQVAIDAPKVPGKLNAEVKLTGKATNYTGAAVDGAKVKWRVVRQVRYPIWWHWCSWRYPPQPNDHQEIAHGTAKTAADGTFDVKFKASPNSKISAESEPTFQFTVHADVTSTTGETRSADRTINVGYTALSASMSADEWQTTKSPVEITISTTTLDGEPQSADGVIKVYRLKQPKKIARTIWRQTHPHFGFRNIAPQRDPTNPNSWPLGEVVSEQKFTTDASGKITKNVKLPAGPYRVMLETQDRFGKPISAQLPLNVLAAGAKHLNIRVANHFAAPKWSVEPGEEFLALWGSGYEKARAFVEIEHRHKIVQSYWTDAKTTQSAIRQKVNEGMRGGFTVRVTMVRENRAYLTSRQVMVPWTNKQLTVKWEHFVSKLEPAKRETWTAIVKGPDAKKAVAEMVAGLYDASLDAYRPHQWMQQFNVFRQDHSSLNSTFENQMRHLRHLHGYWPNGHKSAILTYRAFPNEIISNLWGYQLPQPGKKPGAGFPVPTPYYGFVPGGYGYGRGRRFASKGRGELGNNKYSETDEVYAVADLAMGDDDGGGAGNDALAATGAREGRANGTGQATRGPDLSKVSARRNLNETAFFFPHLVSNKDGEVRLEFTMPEALTEWKFMGFAHDVDLRGGYLQDKVVTSKDLMIEPNPPRFLREGDQLEFAVKVSNQSAARQTGTVRLTFSDARTGVSVDELLGNATLDREFDVASKQSKTFTWRLNVPDDLGFLTYKAVGSTGRLSDGEENYLPVLSRRILITESLPLPIRGKETKTFEFKRLADAAKSDTIRHKSLTVQMVSNPSWYAVMALPYLMEYPHQCSEQIFNRLYANSLARHIAASDPKIRRVFDQWRATPALDSPLEKNQDLKAVMLEETPWLRQAKSESEARRKVGVLFDENRLNAETARALQQLAVQQRPDGAWPWFPGGPPNDYITLYITTGFGRLRHLGVELDMAPAVKSLERLDGWIDRTYRHIRHKEQNHLSPTIALYLYGRSFYLDDKPIAPKYQEAVNYYRGQAQKFWLQVANRQSQAHLAVALKRFGDKKTPVAIMRSIKERSVSDEELGMFWRELEHSWSWYRAPIETQAMMIEAFDEVMNDAEAVEDCKVWLLKQKQTQAWQTTKSTADAVYALLLRGSNLLASDALVEVSLGGKTIKPEKVEAGTGFYQHRFIGPEITAKQAKVVVAKSDEGVAWGSVHWQYLEDIGKVTSYEGTPLKLEKSLYIRVNTTKGPELKKVDDRDVKVGDELVCRIVLRTDRDMEFVHMKDYRGSGTEPVNVLSKYKFQDGLYYYESTRDTASHFFIDYLPKGVYVFEYSVRVQHKGSYQTGPAEIQCMYAPEFNSHSGSVLLKVK